MITFCTSADVMTVLATFGYDFSNDNAQITTVQINVAIEEASVQVRAVLSPRYSSKVSLIAEKNVYAVNRLCAYKACVILVKRFSNAFNADQNLLKGLESAFYSWKQHVGHGLLGYEDTVLGWVNITTDVGVTLSQATLSSPVFSDLEEDCFVTRRCEY